ncbi:OsmC family protein [candidate division WOR-3 bacterium]|nr:OsmC family protein [candidate division WOR-3 bacterium]
MKASSHWLEKYKTKIDDGRGHEILSDQTPDYGGDDTGPTPLDLVVMGLAGCVNVLYVMVAQKMRLKYKTLQVDVEADKPKEARTIERARIVLKINTAEDDSKVQKCLEQAEAMCPIGAIFQMAGIEIKSRFEKVG